MSTLASYFESQFHFDRRDLREVEEAIGECARLFAECAESPDAFTAEKGWNYAYPVQGKESEKGITPSISTTAMIGAALQRLAGRSPSKRAAEGYPDRPLFKKLKTGKEDEVRDAVKNTTSALSNLICKAETASDTVSFFKSVGIISDEQDFNVDKDRKRPAAVYSKSYGPDDPGTLGWCWDIVGNSQDTELKDTRKALDAAIGRYLDELSDSKPGDRTMDRMLMPKGADVGDSAFIALRLIRMIKAAENKFLSKQKGAADKISRSLTKYFEERLHRHLSYGEIPDSRFDAAELSFCLEGLMHCDRWRIDERIMRRSVDVLRKTQEASAFWRSETPIIARGNGLVLLPVSVEAANSLLAAVAMFDDAKRIHDTVGSECLPMLQRFWRWLKSRRVEVNVPEGTSKVYGWHSEHVNDKNIIHLWETSQVLEFLLSFRHFLKLHIARTTLDLSGVKNDWFKPSDDVFNPGEIGIETWRERHWNSFEPWRRIAGQDTGAYARIWNDFVEPRARELPKAAAFDFWGGPFYSMLLYGPPGTGKSTVPENLAKLFDCRLISLSVSDFMEAGAAQMEARAKQIFEMLAAQPFCVVLFDEFDPFMYDRDSEMFKKLSPEFQLMTNGMLPKLSTLRKSESVLFVFATNYLDRIDAAIRRTGRFDRRYVLPLMDWASRANAISGFIADALLKAEKELKLASAWDKEIEEALEGAKLKSGKPKHRLAEGLRVVLEHESTGIRKVSVHFGFSDIKAACDAAFSDAEILVDVIKKYINKKETDKQNKEIDKQNAAAMLLELLARLKDEMSTMAPSVSMKQVGKRLFEVPKPEQHAHVGAGVGSVLKDRAIVETVVEEYLGLVAIELDAGKDADKGFGDCLKQAFAEDSPVVQSALKGFLFSIGYAPTSGEKLTADSVKTTMETRCQYAKAGPT
jgi:hypothetical protein